MKNNINKGTEDLKRTFFSNSNIIRKCQYGLDYKVYNPVLV